MDRRNPYTLSVLSPSTDGAEESRTQIQAQLREFVLVFQLDGAFIYRYVLYVLHYFVDARVGMLTFDVL